MTRQEFVDYCLTFPDAYEDYPFKNGETSRACATMRHRSNKKIFALINEHDGQYVNLKCEPFKADFLRSIYEGITPGYHMNKVHWNTVRIPSDVPDNELMDMIDSSYELTSPKRKA